ncbi:hypothetical protein ACI782_22000 [Geodermatophilus sp. SYSU D00703]
MILAAGLLVLIGLGAFVGGLLTGATALYWGCVAACALAAVLLVVARLGSAGATARPPEPPRRREEPVRRAPGAPGTPPRGRAAVRVPASDDVPVAEPPLPEPEDEPSTGAHAAVARGASAAVTADGEPAEEDVEVTDLLLVVDLGDDVLVVDEHPRYHLAGCPHLADQRAVPLPMVEAREDGFTPCATCRPVHHLAGTERVRRRAARGG